MLLVKPLPPGHHLLMQKGNMRRRPAEGDTAEPQREEDNLPETTAPTCRCITLRFHLELHLPPPAPAYSRFRPCPSTTSATSSRIWRRAFASALRPAGVME